MAASVNPAAETNGAAPGDHAGPNGAPKLPTDPTRVCANCGGPLAESQQWCLQCGAAATDSLARARDWRALAVLAAVGALVLAGAATAGALALTQKPTRPPTHLVIAQVPAVTQTAPATPSTGSALGTTPGASTTSPGVHGSSTLGGVAGRGAAGLPSSAIRPPRLPALVPTPHASTTPHASIPAATTPASTPTPTTSTPTTTTPSSQSHEPNQASNPILLDTNAASTYNPSGYPAAYFGDPALAIDGETSTAWTAQVEPKVAPLMAAGLALDLKTPTRVGTLEVVTPSIGLTVEVFGANASKLPETITDPAWTRLAPTHVIRKHKGIIKLGGAARAFRFLVLWLVKAPVDDVGTPTAPGHVTIDELVPYPPAS